MPLSKEKMREYMKNYRLKNPEYEEKINENYKKKYHNDLEYREKRKEYFISYNNKKKDINNIQIIA
jgi:hypothetical protein